MGWMTTRKLAAHWPRLPPGAGQRIRLAPYVALTPRQQKIDGNRRYKCLSCAKVEASACDLKCLPVTMRQQSERWGKILACPISPQSTHALFTKSSCRNSLPSSIWSRLKPTVGILEATRPASWTLSWPTTPARAAGRSRHPQLCADSQTAKPFQDQWNGQDSESSLCLDRLVIWWKSRNVMAAVITWGVCRHHVPWFLGSGCANRLDKTWLLLLLFTDTIPKPAPGVQVLLEAKRDG